MKKLNIFYSWQSDSDEKLNRYFIRDILKDLIKNFTIEKSFELNLDQATKDRAGSPSITTSIFEKIDSASAFICDVSSIVTFNEKAIPNPNVMIELGYAAKVLGWEKIIMIANTSTGSIKDLPFDIRDRRILAYKLSDKSEIVNAKKIVSVGFKEALTLVLNNKKVITPFLYSHDIELFKKFNEVLPFGRGSIEFLKNRDITVGRWRRSKLDNLLTFVDTWSDPDHTFINEELENLRASLFSTISEYLYQLDINSEPANETIQQMFVPNDYLNWFDPDDIHHVNFKEIMNQLDEKSKNILKIHEELYKKGRELSQKTLMV